jgi:hypothetical protein
LHILPAQIADDIGYEYENPAVRPFVHKAVADLQGMLQNMTPVEALEDLKKLAEDTVNYIRETVIQKLARQPEEEETRYLQFFAEACHADGVERVDIFSLNHDTLVERALAQSDNRKFSVLDGLRNASNGDGSRRWDPRVYDDPSRAGTRVSIFKLHGTIGWITWESAGGSKYERRFIGTYTNDPNTPPLYRKVGQPMILVGAFDKILRYNSQPFIELQYRFMRALEDESCTALIVCGYSFGDKGVNTRIVEWMRRSPNNRLLVIDPQDSQMIHERARGAIQQITNIILLRAKRVINKTSDPLAAYLYQKWQGSFLVKHLQRTMGKSLKDNIREVTWEELSRRITGTDAMFLASED